MNFYFVTKNMPNGEEFEYTWLMDFDIADHFGEKAIKDTYKNALKFWKKDIVAIAQLYVALNMRLWFWYEKGNEKYAKIYDELFYKLRDYVYSEKPHYTKEELNTFFRITD